MSPAPTARARPSRSCARSSRRRACACMSTPRRISCVSTSASASAQVGEGVLVSDDELAAAFEECERANAGAPITVFEITTAAGLSAVCAPSGRCAAARSRARRPARRHQCGRRADRHRRHAGLVRPCRLSRRQRRQDRGREGRHLQARRARDRRGAAARGADGDRARGGARRARRSESPARTGPRPRSAAGWSIRTTPGCSICRRRGCRDATSSRMQASRSRRCARLRR